MEKYFGLPNVLFGKVLKISTFTIVFLALGLTACSQCLDSLITGNWFEVYKKKQQYYLPLQIALNSNGSAKYINRYPENSYNLSYTICADSIITLNNGETFKVLFINKNIMKLKKKGKTILLRKSARL